MCVLHAPWASVTKPIRKTQCQCEAVQRVQKHMPLSGHAKVWTLSLQVCFIACGAVPGPVAGIMRLRDFASALAVCLVLATFQAAAATPSSTPIVTAIAIGSGNVDSPASTIKVNCTVSNYNYDNDDDNDDQDETTPSGYVYFLGVSHTLCFC